MTAITPQAQHATWQPDILTVAGIAVLAYILSTALHELVGHGGACWALGGHAREIGAYYFSCDVSGMRPTAVRLVEAAGNTANFLAAMITLPLFQRARSWYGRWFLWLLLTVNLFDWSGYFLFSGFSGIGDWGNGPTGVFFGIKPDWLWRGVLAVGGTALYSACARFSARLLQDLVPSTKAATRLNRTAYVSGGILALLIGLINPLGLVIVITSSLASSLGGTSGLLWLAYKMPRQISLALQEDKAPVRSWSWLLVSFVVTLIFALVLGPSRHFR